MMIQKGERNVDGLKKKLLSFVTTGNLAKKISAAVGALVVFCMTIMVFVSTLLSRDYLQKSIDGEFAEIADKNGVVVQTVLDEAVRTASDLQNYIEEIYDEWGENGYNGLVEKSVLYNIDLQQLNKKIEDYILHTAWSTVANSDYIEGVGAFFEPDAFDPNIKDYTIYVSKSDAQNKTCQSYGSYSNYGSQDSYSQTITKKTTVFTQPYEDQGIMMITAAFPIFYKNEVQGIVAVDINIENFSALDSSNEQYKSMFTQILMSDSTMVYDSESDAYTGQKLSDMLSSSEYAKIQKKIDTGNSFSVYTKKADGSALVRYYTPIQAESETWWAVSALNKSDLNKDSTYLMTAMILIAVVSILIIVFVTKRLIAKYIKPIESVVSASQQLKDGNFDILIETESDDEIGELADAFSQAAVILRNIINDLKSVLGEMADSNFNIRTQVDYPGEFDSIKVSLFALAEDISHTLSEIHTVSEAVAVNAENISQGAQALTDGATEQATAVEELQSTITDVSEEVGGNAERANKKAKTVGEDITRTNAGMEEVVRAMEEINQSSVKINAIINSINDIASQTNLLALNASIEAARAGETGKGFAVVASQVGLLAAQSASAAKDSTALIQDTLNAVERGKGLVDMAAENLVASAAQTKELVQDIALISKASEHQANDLKELLESADQIAAVVQENTAMAEENSASSDELAAQAEKLKGLIAAFELYQK